MSLQIANTVKSQITVNTFMCVGASEFQALPSNEDQNSGLSFRARISGNQRQHIVIRLMWNDTYTVSQTITRKGVTTTKFEASDIYCDQLDEVVFQIGSTKFADLDKLDSYGIEKVVVPYGLR